MRETRTRHTLIEPSTRWWLRDELFWQLTASLLAGAVFLVAFVAALALSTGGAA